MKKLNHLVSGKEKNKLISKKWSLAELSSLSELDDSNIFDCQEFHLIPNESQSGPNHLFVGTREHGQKVEGLKSERYNYQELKAVSALSEKGKGKLRKVISQATKLKSVA